jgi:hypothetical protein
MKQNYRERREEGGGRRGTNLEASKSKGDYWGRSSVPGTRMEGGEGNREKEGGRKEGNKEKCPRTLRCFFLRRTLEPTDGKSHGGIFEKMNRDFHRSSTLHQIFERCLRRSKFEFPSLPPKKARAGEAQRKSHLPFSPRSWPQHQPNVETIHNFSGSHEVVGYGDKIF